MTAPTVGRRGRRPLRRDKVPNLSLRGPERPVAIRTPVPCCPLPVALSERGMGRAMLAPTAGTGGEARAANDRPYGGNVPIPSLRDQSADWSWP